MSQQQQLDLLRRVASASNYISLDKFLPQLEQLTQWAKGEFDKDRLARHIADTGLIRHTYEAASNSIKKLSDACNGLYTNLPAIPSSCVVELLYLCDVCLPEKCLKGNPAMCKHVRAQIVQTDFLRTFAGLCSAIADAITQRILAGRKSSDQHTTASSHKPSSRSRRRSKAHRTAATEQSSLVAADVCLAQLLAGLWLRLSAVWETASTTSFPKPRLDNETFPVIAFDPDFQPTIAPTSALSLALLRHTSSNNGASDDFISWNVAARALNIMRSISVVAYREITNARGAGGRWEDDAPDPATAGVKEMLKSQQLQELLLYSLAINLQLLQEQQQGLTAVPSMEPATADAGGAGNSGAANPQASRRHKSSSALEQQSQPVEDHTVCVLQLLGLSGISLDQYKEYSYAVRDVKAQQSPALDAAVNNLEQAFSQSNSLPAPWQQPQQASSSSSSSSSDQAVALHIAVLKLLLQNALLRHSQRSMYDSIRCMVAVTLTLTETYHSRIEAQATPAGSAAAARAAAVAQRVLAPLVLQLGPAVLHAQKQEEQQKGLKEGLLHMYDFIWRCMLKAGLTTDAETQQQLWADIFNQAPFTACAALELAMREAAKGSCSNKALGFVIEHVVYIIQAASQNDKLLKAVHTAQQHGGLESKSLGSQPFSLLATAVKFCTIFIDGAYDSFQALELAIAASEAAQQFASKPGGSAAAAPCVHLAAKALACCGKVLLWPHTKGTAEDRQAWLDLEQTAKRVLERDCMAADDEAESALQSAESDSDKAESAGRAESHPAEVIGPLAGASASPDNAGGSPSNTDSSNNDSDSNSLSDDFGAVSFFGNPFEGRETPDLSVLLRKIVAAVSWCSQQQPFSASSSGSNSSAGQAPAAAKVSQPDAGAGELMLSVQAAQQLQKGLNAAVQLWEGSIGEWWGPGKNHKTYPCWDMFVAARKAVGYQLALQLQQFGLDTCAAAPTLLCCNNPGCGNMGESGHLFVSELACVRKSKCSKCQAAGYCSRACQVQHWKQHKKLCGVLCQD